MSTAANYNATRGFGFTIFAKKGGSLTKRIYLGPDGKPVSDGSLCAMRTGTACRSSVQNVQSFSDAINALQPMQALSVGSLRLDLPESVSITTIDMLAVHSNNATITRTRSNFEFPQAPGFIFFDHDPKHLSQAVKDKTARLGGFIPALLSVAPELAGARVVVRKSTSSCLSRSDTGTTFPDGDGMHLYIPVQDLSDYTRVLQVIHCRLWIAELGCFALSKAGSLLDRSLVDTAVAEPERLIFESAPTVTPPLIQDRAARQAKVITLDGMSLPGIIGPDGTVDTRRAIQPLTSEELREKNEVMSLARRAIEAAASRARANFVEAREKEAVARGAAPAAAKRAAIAWAERILLPDAQLAFDDKSLGVQGQVLVRDILKNQAAYVGKSLADPEEGVAYGPAKAHVNTFSSDEAWIYSHAHGGQRFWLRHDANSLEDAVNAVTDADKPRAYAVALAQADIEGVAEEALRQRLIIDPGHASARSMNELVENLREVFSQARGDAPPSVSIEAGDGRKRLMAWSNTTPVTDIVLDIDRTFAAVPGLNPPMRDLDGALVRIGMEMPSGLHRLSEGAADGDRADFQPPPAQRSIIRLNQTAQYLQFEQHIDLIGRVKNGEWISSRVSPNYLTLYAGHYESALPKIGAIVATPVILPDGTIRIHAGPDHEGGCWCVDPAVAAKCPRTQTVTRAEIVDALLYMLNDWLGDTTTDFTGRCSLITATLTGVQRTLLPARPGFIMTAAQRGSGKSTAAGMVGSAVSGIEPAVGAWSEDVTERRKAILSYLMLGPATLLFDNIPRGAEIDCPILSEILTARSYKDRVLGESRISVVSAQVLLMLTGNSLRASEDNASRLLGVPFTADRPDPENRAVRREAPIAWTIAERPELLRALFTIGVAHHVAPEIVSPKTAVKGRFPEWWNLVARPVETAAALATAAEATERRYYDALVTLDRAEANFDYLEEEEAVLAAEEVAGGFLSSAALKISAELWNAQEAVEQATSDVLDAWVALEPYAPAGRSLGQRTGRRYPQQPEAVSYGQILRENERTDPKNEAAAVVFNAIRQAIGIGTDFTAKDLCDQVLAPATAGGGGGASPEEFEDALRRLSNTDRLRTRTVTGGVLMPDAAAVGRALGRIKGQRFGSVDRQFWLEQTREGDGHKPSRWQIHEQ